MATLFADIENQFKAGDRPSELRGISQEQVRLGFVRKVYGIVCAQVVFTAAVAALCVHGPLAKPLLVFVAGRPGLYKWGSLVSTMAALFCLMACKKRYPLNLWVLGAFTAVISVNVGVVCAMVSAAGLGGIIVQAAAITSLLFGGLTLYAFKSKRNFSFLGATLFPLLFAMSAFGLLSVFFPGLRMGITGLLYSLAGAMIFCAYIVFDTFRILHVLKPDDYVEAAIQLYLDIINLFLYILDILLKLSKNSSRQ
ncbi:unnamed protein product [Polarella glacialis]|uniref:Transmembrane BAX inhibitor motif-containing protein 4 n=1 Tax=Polarella glacialis TaxID=89957 RepID=A0A813FXD4_POLGL|nr:unnamed protein product [Polarella glacialis]CAE8618717.1 unnamed protein product [Polarella glacialis]CAE8735340.1 unnamed protein product [Polarella glacialis]|mmetsp:Transcript_31433/g.56386  ORF Transcript_31433/g.56386 Transcript_31433/m.56386 type:complete len:253 (-) Transcript_31433:98-856(-)|eukprot:CAMPEP_0115060820 /NCGR_PEP_ID=MMETSP0227-20121206/7669_1 /TAXON_ID=89957 /ORGANISM="Polarella glacialis, Strain CCMP 1383" /LENGTH=252 /DNA_ID=CAMNT_0002446063 /DNA_START=172 /DNA_END=930 /DNA_ORIENTATION=-